MPVDYLAWLSLGAANLNHDDLITADLTQINMASAGILDKLPDAKTSFTPLISTSMDSMAIPVATVQGAPDPAGMLRDFQPGGKQLVLAAHVTGPADTAFPDGPPPPDKKDDKATAAEPPASASPCRWRITAISSLTRSICCRAAPISSACARAGPRRGPSPWSKTSREKI